MNQETYTKIFLKANDHALTAENIKTYQRRWWMNNRRKDQGGLRLTEEGFQFVKETLDLRVYEVPFPITLDLKAEVILFLDKFIDCPYYLTEVSIFVLSERKNFELHLFAGDVHKYGLIKAMKRKNQSKEEQ
jgi:hypothetical protein